MKSLTRSLPAANCDNGVCTNGVCTGGFGDACASDDTACLGYLYCQTPDFLDTAANTCGAVGAFCQDPTAVDPALSVAAAQLIFNNFCATGYCSSTFVFLLPASFIVLFS